MSTKRAMFIGVLGAIAGLAIIPLHAVRAAAILVEQTDGTASARIATGCDNRCSDITMGFQTFAPLASGTLGAIEVFTSDFRTNSREPDYNTCYLTLSDAATGQEIARSDNSYHGYGCAGDLLFTFKNSKPSLAAGITYQWNYVFGGQNFSQITFLGSDADTVSGQFGIPPLADAKFIIYATIEPPEHLLMFRDGIENSSVNPVVGFSAEIPSPTPDSLQLQVEVEPSFVPFTGVPNLETPLVTSDASSSARMATTTLPNGSYHWAARSKDAEGNTSDWIMPSGPSTTVDFYVTDPSHGIIMEDDATTYSLAAEPDPCWSDGSRFSCALTPTSTIYDAKDPFTASSIVFDWKNYGGGNNCDGLGNYQAAITDPSKDYAPLATTTDTVYLGCARNGQGTAELHFGSTAIPKEFSLLFNPVDGGLQGGSRIAVSHIMLHGVSLSSSTSTSSPSSASSSTVPSPPSPSRKPVVIIPGILGSYLDRTSDGGEVWPNTGAMLTSLSDGYLDELALSPDGTQVSHKEMSASDIIRTATSSIPFANEDFYAPLLGSLEAAGYREGTDLFVAPYDWRFDAASSSRTLASVLHTAAAHSPNGKVDVIAHSMGALVADAYLAATPDAPVDALILVAPPQLGAPQMFKALQFGDDLGFRLGPFSLLNPAEVRSIAKNMPGVYELLPSRHYSTVSGGYLIDNRNGGHHVLDFDETAALMAADGRNTTLMASAEAFHAAHDLSPIAQASVYDIIGCQDPGTPAQFVLQDNGSVDLLRGNGDGTVPVPSAIDLAEGYTAYFSLYSENGADHIGLIRDPKPLALINAILQGSTSSRTLAPLGFSTSTADCLQGRSSLHNETTIEVIAQGPVSLDAYDTDGRHTGGDRAEIPGSIHDALPDTEMLMLPASDTYRIAANATASGMFSLKIKSYDDAAHLMSTASYIAIGLPAASTTATFSLSSSTPAPTLSLEISGSSSHAVEPTALLPGDAGNDTTPPIITMSDIPDRLSESESLPFTFSARDDATGIAFLDGTLDGGPIPSSTLLEHLNAGTHTLNITAIDGAGNPRTVSRTFTIRAAASAGTEPSPVINVPAGISGSLPLHQLPSSSLPLPVSSSVPFASRASSSVRTCRPRPH